MFVKEPECKDIGMIEDYVSESDLVSTVLLIDDDPLVGEAIKVMLGDASDIELYYCGDASEAIALAEKIEPKVILLDIIMPDIDGLTVLRYLRASEKVSEVPVVALSVKEDPAVKAQFFSSGGNDYLIKLPDQVEMMARLRYHTKAYNLLLERNQAFKALKASQNKLAEANIHLEKLASIDPLTNVLNRRQFDLEMDREWRNCIRQKLELSIVMLDIDYFKNCNDVYGHQKGDEILRQVADLAGSKIRRSYDRLARFGGEEFIMLLPHTPLEGAFRVAEIIRSGIESLMIENKGPSDNEILTVSCGVCSSIPTKDSRIGDFIGAADKALYKAKEQGRNQVCGASLGHLD